MSETENKPGWQAKALKMVLVLVAVIVVSVGALEAAYFSTLQTITRNKAQKVQQGVLSVLGFDASLEGLSARFKENIDIKEFPGVKGKTFTVWTGKKDGKTVGYAARMRGGAFQGIVDIVIGYAPDLNQTTGLEVIETGETPGLGGEMTTCRPDYCFKREFDHLSTVPQVEFIKYREPEKPNQFKAITGATFSTTAIRNFVNEALEQLRALQAAGKL